MTEIINTSSTPVQRAERVQFLRALADLLEQHPEVKVPYSPTLIEWGPDDSMDHYRWDVGFAADTAAQARATIRAIGGTWGKEADEETMRFVGTFAGRGCTVEVQRDLVCEPRVVGKKTIEQRELKTPAEYLYREVEVDDIVWDCGSLLEAAMEGKPDRLEKEVEA
jgi:hypothetical protein